MFKCVVSIILIMLNERQIQDFPQGGGAPTPKIYIIVQSFAKNGLKMKEFGPSGAGCESLAPTPLDLPTAIILFSGNEIEFPK